MTLCGTEPGLLYWTFSHLNIESVNRERRWTVETWSNSSVYRRLKFNRSAAAHWTLDHQHTHTHTLYSPVLRVCV